MNKPSMPEKQVSHKKRLPFWPPALLFAGVYLGANVYFFLRANCQWDYTMLALWAGASVALYLIIWRIERYVARVERFIKHRHGHGKKKEKQ